MSESEDMERPVTRRELRTELDKVDTKLGLLGGMLLEKMAEMEARLLGKMAEMETRWVGKMAEMETRMVAEMARQTRSAMEWARDQFRVVDDKYAELPARVGRLERKVFPPRRARRR